MPVVWRLLRDGVHRAQRALGFARVQQHVSVDARSTRPSPYGRKATLRGSDELPIQAPAALLESTLSGDPRKAQIRHETRIRQ